MATKSKKAPATDSADDLLGNGAAAPAATEGADDLLGGGDAKPAKAKAKAKPAAKAAAKAPKAEKAAAAPKAAKPKAAASGARGARGTGKYFYDPDERAALAKRIGSLKKATSTKEMAEKFEVDTWKARTAAADLVKAGKGTLAKVGSTLTFTPA